VKFASPPPAPLKVFLGGPSDTNHEIQGQEP